MNSNVVTNREYGIYDINGSYNNPLTNKPYKNIYQHKNISIGTEILPRTYANLGKIWASKIVYNNKDLIIETIVKNQIILLTAGTGVGKTILVPRIALHAFDYKDKIICTIPKRIPTLKNAEFVAECMDVVLGEEVGYYYQGANQTDKNGVESKLIFTTTGSLISRMTGTDPLLSDYKCVIIDEAHERSVQTDQILLLLKNACKERSELKVIIMSATIALQLFRDYFPKKQFKFGEIDAGSELSFPVTEKWISTTPLEWQKTAIDTVIKILKTSTTGDIMIFVKSGGDANKLCILLNSAINDLRKQIIADTQQHTRLLQKNTKLISKHSSSSGKTHKKSSRKTHSKSLSKYKKGSTISKQTDKTDKTITNTKHSIPPEYLINPLCLRLDGSSPGDERELAIDENIYKTLKDSKGYPYTRKIVITTNVAESSVTVEGIVYIIDSGYEYTESYEPNSRVRSLLENTIAQSAVKQRKGRAGRTRAGECYHLYSNKDYHNFEEYPIPSIEKSDITNDILDLMRIPTASTVKQIRNLLNEFISPPHEKFILNSLRTLQALGAITDITPSGHITQMGLALTRFRAIKVNYARALIASYFYGCARSVCDIIALVTVADGMINTIFLNYYADKKKTPEMNKKESYRHMNIIKSYAHPLGDYMTLFKAYKLYLTKLSQFQPILPTRQLTKKHSQIHSKIHSKTKSKSTSKLDIDIRTTKGGGDDILVDLDDGVSQKTQDPPSIKKWCKDNYLHAKHLSQARATSRQLFDTLMKTVRPYDAKYKNPHTEKIHEDKPHVDATHEHEGGFIQKIKEQESLETLEKNVQRFASEDDNIMMSLSIGNFVNFAIKSNEKKGDNVYTSCFAQTKKLGKINRDSFLSSAPQILMYDELFMSSRDAKFVKINIANKIPDNVFHRLVALYGQYIRQCMSYRSSSY